ncbi:DUF4476 domain-containing protein [Sanyastnella coralliicola]|uniref:DUF4476 domain-containing protein n=1 Tax=Sanyastnella coralliicola TaxID=3069118 RepID=UPI0027BB1A00|nr:DUF4476 domain-containing protein [Longitalea sp. SCSIO 12813]
MFFALSGGTQSFAQCDLKINNPDSLEFRLFIGGASVETEITEMMAIDSVDCGMCLLDIIVIDSLNVHLRTDLNVDTSWTPELQLRNDSLGIRLEVLNPKEQATVDYTAPVATRNSEINVQVFALDGAACAPPATPAQLSRWIGELEKMDFERQRLKYLENLTRQEVCLTTSQIRQLCAYIDDENKRLDFLNASYANCYDRSQFAVLEDLLYLERSKEAFRGIAE